MAKPLSPSLYLSLLNLSVEQVDLSFLQWELSVSQNLSRMNKKAPVNYNI